MKGKRKTWERWVDKGEGPRAYDLFLLYFELGPLKRSCSQVATESGRKLATVNELCFRFKWVQRSGAYDKYLQTLQAKAIENQVKADALIIAERESIYRHESFDTAKKLLDRGKQMLASPLYEEKITKTQVFQIEPGQTQIEVPIEITVKPARWNFKTAEALIHTGDQLARLSLNIPTARGELNVNWSEDPEKRLVNAKVTMRQWIEKDLPAAIERVMNENPQADPVEVRQQLLSAAPGWFANDWQIDDPTLLLEAAPLAQPTSLPISDESDSVN